MNGVRSPAGRSVRGAGRGASAATLSDVARYAGVSRQTVSNAINSPELLRSDTLSRVQEAIATLGYSPNRAARNLRTQSSRLIGLRFPPAQEGTANALLDRFVHSLTETSQAAGYHVLLFSGDPEDPTDQAYDELIRSHSVDAFIVTDTYLGNPQTRWLRERGFPFAAFGRPWNDADSTHPWVDVDGAAGIELATHHLADAGHQRLAFLGWESDSPIMDDRHVGWQRAAGDRGVYAVERRVLDTVEAGARAAAELLDAEQISGFVCASDTLAMGVLHTLWHRQLAPGAEVGVVGFDDSQVAQVVQPGLTSVRQPLEEVAVHLVAALGRIIGSGAAEADDESDQEVTEDANDESREQAGLLLSPTLVVRGSSSRKS